MTNSKLDRIAILGGGFSGVMTAVNLARLSPHPLHVTIINEHRPAGRGVAYGTRRMEHLLNVAARNMSAFPDQPEHLLQWLRTRSEFDQLPERELRERFIPRMIYGDYLCSLMQHHFQGAGGMTPVKVDFIEGEAVDIEPGGVVHLAEGRRERADRVVLAAGNETPAELPGAETLSDHPAWIGNPWLPWQQRLPAHGGIVVLLGTGLTTVDAILTVRALGWPGSIHAISRHGWLPESHFRGIEYPDFPPPGADLTTLGLEKLVALLERALRPAARARREPRHHRRQNAAAHPAHLAGLQRRREAELRAPARRALECTAPPHRPGDSCADHQRANHRTTHRARGQHRTPRSRRQQSARPPRQRKTTRRRSRHQCHRPANALQRHALGAFANLLRRGLVSPDEMDMGVRVDVDHTVLAGDGARSPLLLALGPLLRGTLWETIAVPELRAQARRVAETLLDQAHAEDTAPLMMEYMI